MKVICKPNPKGAFHLENRGYDSYAQRANAVRQLIRRGFNYFIGYRDTQSEHALQFGKVTRDDGTPATLRMVDCYPVYYYGRRIQCAVCGKRHPFRPTPGKCPGFVKKPPEVI